jgi:hypothetical protein
MEGLVERTESITHAEVDTLRKNAPKQVEFLINRIDGFAEMPTLEKLSALLDLLNKLDPKDNANRFVAERIATKVRGLELTAEYQKNMAELGEIV